MYVHIPLRFVTGFWLEILNSGHFDFDISVLFAYVITIFCDIPSTRLIVARFHLANSSPWRLEGDRGDWL